MVTQRLTPCSLPVLLAFCAMLSISLPQSVAAKALWKFSPEKGFVDDAIAFSADGARVALILSDSATFMELAILDLSSRKIVKRLPLGAVTRVPKHLHFIDDNSLLLLWSDSEKGQAGADLIWISGKKKTKQLKGATHLQLVAYKGKKVLAASYRRDHKRGGYKVRIQLHRLTDLRRLRSTSLSVRADATIKRPALRVLYWGPGMTTLVGLERGKFDKARDIRLPDVAVWYDVFRRKEVAKHTPQKLVNWNHALEMREAHPHQRRFLHVDRNLGPLYLADQHNRLREIKTPIPWRLYEPKSLHQRESWDGKELHFSMTIDPVNPDAVARKKADKERADIYRVTAAAKPVLLGKVPTGKRRFTWVVGKGHFAYLYKLKGFGRGGKSIEIHAIAP